MSSLRLAIAQINCLVGDIDANLAKIILNTQQAITQYTADVVVFPELALTGYPPEDLLMQSQFAQQVQSALNRLCQAKLATTLIVGYPHYHGKAIYNAAAVIQNGEIILVYHKQQLPNYGVFDERRYFTPGAAASGVFTIRSLRCAVLICEDIWTAQPVAAAAQQADILITLNASPYHMDKWSARKKMLDGHSPHKKPVVYANLVGGQDSLLFDGSSMIIDQSGHIQSQAAFCAEDLQAAVITPQSVTAISASTILPTDRYAALYTALVLGVRDYMHKNYFKSAVLGLSGGVDSALTLCIACDAIGAENVRAWMLHSPYTRSISLTDAKALCERLHVSYDALDIAPLMGAFSQTLSYAFSADHTSNTQQNIQARIRGTLLMALSNQTNALLLTTGNKSELAVGYSTLYGDMAGGFSVLKDVYKTDVYRLCHWYNEKNNDAIPQRIVTRAPSAELMPDQTDEDNLPPYELLDPVLNALIEERLDPNDVHLTGVSAATIQAIAQRIQQQEFKRRQSAPGIRVTRLAFDRDRRYPITQNYRDTS